MGESATRAETYTWPEKSLRAVRSNAARFTSGPFGPIETSRSTLNSPDGCSTDNRVDPFSEDPRGMTVIDEGTEPGSRHAVATETAPSTPMLE